MSHEDGWNFLNTNDYDKNEGSYFGSSSGSGNINPDGSGSYYGDDGSVAYRNADGSGTYYGADGSYGFRDADGTGSFFGEDGSFGMSDSDGSSYFSPSFDSEQSLNRSTADNVADLADSVSSSAEAVANLILLARDSKQRAAASHSPTQKGHSLVLWIFLSILGIGIPFIIYYSVSKDHYWY